MKKIWFLAGLLLMFCVSCATSASSEKYSYVYDIGAFEEFYNLALEFENEQEYEVAYSTLVNRLSYFLDTDEGKNAYDRLITFLFSSNNDIKYLYGKEELSKENAHKIIVDLREKIPELYARVQAKLEESKNTKFEPAYDEALKLESEGKIEEAYKLMQPFHEFKLNDELKAKFNECYSRLEQKIKENQVNQMLNEKKSLYQKLFPRFLSFLESEDVNPFELKSYLELKKKYPSFNLDRISTFKTTIFSKYDEFELYEICTILDNDLRSSLFNNTPDVIFKNFSYNDGVKWSTKSVEPNFENKTYTYNIELLIVLKFKDIILDVFDLFDNCKYTKRKVMDALDNGLYATVYFKFESQNENKYEANGVKILLGKYNIDYSLTTESSLNFCTWWWDGNIGMREIEIANVPSKAYKPVSIRLSKLRMEEKNRTNNTSAYSNKTSQSNYSNSSSNSSLKDLFGSIICEECNKNLALYDCFDPVKNIRVSLCRPCLQKKEQEYNAKYQKAINDIRNL